MTDEYPIQADHTIDASGLACPLPLLKLKLGLRELAVGQTICVIATDAGSKKDIPVYCELSGNLLLKTQESGERILFWVKRVNKP